LNAPAAWLWQPESDILSSTLHVRVGGTFVFPPPGVLLDDVSRVIFVAGGVGVNPLVSMLTCLVEELEHRSGQRRQMEVIFSYASKMPGSGTLSDVLFLDRVARLVERANALRNQGVQARMSLRLTNSAFDKGVALPPSCDERYVNLQQGRLMSQELVNLVQKGDSVGSFVYICGPPEMTDDFTDSLHAAGIDRQRVLTEKWW
jgi:ferredoxin-NADP reductase